LDLNLRAVMLATQLVLTPMAGRGGGAIVNIASVAGLGTTSHDTPEYAVAKAGVIRFTACMAPLHDSIGVRVNCICPGLVDTPASRRSRDRMTPAEVAALPPVLAPADIAEAAMTFLADDTVAGRIMVCRGGQPGRLLPLIDWQTALPLSLAASATTHRARRAVRNRTTSSQRMTSRSSSRYMSLQVNTSMGRSSRHRRVAPISLSAR